MDYSRNISWEISSLDTRFGSSAETTPNAVVVVAMTTALLSSMQITWSQGTHITAVISLPLWVYNDLNTVEL